MATPRYHEKNLLVSCPVLLLALYLLFLLGVLVCLKYLSDIRYVLNMWTIWLSYEFTCIRGYDRVGVKLCTLEGHKYEVTPVVTVRQLGGSFGWRRGYGSARMPV